MKKLISAAVFATALTILALTVAFASPPAAELAARTSMLPAPQNMAGMDSALTISTSPPDTHIAMATNCFGYITSSEISNITGEGRVAQTGMNEAKRSTNVEAAAETVHGHSGAPRKTASLNGAGATRFAPAPAASATTTGS